jgi:predicted HD phosphohydrolase
MTGAVIMRPRAHFLHMQDGTPEDWQIIATEFSRYSKDLTDRVVRHLQLLEGDFGGFRIDRYTHSLQTATRALRAGRDDEYVCCALLHDIGDSLGTFNHPDIAAAILKPFVSEENLWMVQHHGIFQGYYFFHHLGMDRNMREQFRDNPNYERTAEFCELFDSPSFDPHAETFPVVEFEPMLRKLFAQPKHTIYNTAAFE